VQRQVEKAQATPLEAAWPVERQESKPKSISPAAEAGPILPRHTPENDKVADTLRAVSAERPSDSSVEWVPPRKPRPANAPTLIQRAPDKAKASIPEAGHRDSAAVETAVADSTTVPTQIGTLPADLWQLIGQEPPTIMRTALSEQISSTATQPARSAATQQQTAPERPTSQTIEPPPTPEAEQKEGATETQQSDAGEETSDTQQAPESSETADESAKPDVDELARRVYANLKRRLSIEWERMRSKNW
jgi:hypothetical protein